MKLLVLAQTPPPVHGQSVMVQSLVNGLPALGIPLYHVNFRLSRDAADIGRWRPGKITGTLATALQAIAARFKHGVDTLYYVPAPPGKRGALYRDWAILLLCRPFFPRLVLHWHAVGLGTWLETRAASWERFVSGRLLGRASLAIFLADALRADATMFSARRQAIVPNGIEGPAQTVGPPSAGACQLLFLGLCCEEKGLFAAAAAVIMANLRAGEGSRAPSFVLTAAGPFDSDSTALRFRELCAEHPQMLRHVGSVDDKGKRQLFGACHALVLPTTYPAEGMPLVALEALAHDRPIIATRWRALPEIVTPETGILVDPAKPAELVAALERIRKRPPAAGVCRARFIERFTIEQHLRALAQALWDQREDPRV